MENLNIKKLLGETPENAFQAIDLMIKAQNQVVDATHIMSSIIDNPNEMEFHINRMNKFLNQFRDEQV